jgi:hypothetical protein
MGRCMRVDVARPMWGAPIARAPAPNSAAEGSAVLANA